jgi:hypothetical protein
MRSDIHGESKQMKGVDQHRIQSLLQNNPMGAAATVNRQHENSEAFTNNSSAGNVDLEKRLNQSIKNAHKLSKESSNNLEMGGSSKPKVFQKPAAQSRAYDQFDDDISTPQNLIDDSPLLDNGFEDFQEMDEGDVQELKQRHERLVDVILKEEDDLISSHQSFIENTINSGKSIFIIFS